MSEHDALLQDHRVSIFPYIPPVNNYTAWLLTLYFSTFTLVHLHDDETQKQSVQSSVDVKTNSRTCAIGEIQKKPQRLSKTKYRHFHSSEAVFFFFRSKQTYFLSITVSAIWGKSRVTYIRRGWLEIFLRVCRRLFEPSGSGCERDEENVNIESRWRERCFWWTLNLSSAD